MISGLLLLIVLLALSAGFSSAETALFSVDDIRIQTLAQKNHPKALLIKKLKSDTKLLLGTILLGNNTANVAASALATVLTIQTFGQVWVGLATGVLTLSILIFSEFIPKTWAAHNSERAAFMFARPIWLLTKVCAPIVRLLEGIVVHIFRNKMEAEKITVSEDEIKTMASLGVMAGTLEKGEKEMIERVFLFNDITAEDVMTPEEDVEFLNGDWVIAEALPLITEEKFSRYPVFEGKEDEIVGIIHIRDIFEKLTDQPLTALQKVKVKDITQKVMYVPETKPINDLFHDFQKSHAHMAIVINEYGSMVGLVTTDDLLEELVGEIVDETDVKDEIIKRIDKYTVLVHGDEEIKDINDFFNIKLPGRGNKTISRLVLEKLKSLPEIGQSVKLTDRTTATVEKMEKMRIVRVRLTKTPENKKPAEKT
ncbi:MAG: hemolysin family protein [Patescibacteria group bacterium]|nr:hemolysin family protein [Patescibacteria group bacterium]